MPVWELCFWSLSVGARRGEQKESSSCAVTACEQNKAPRQEGSGRRGKSASVSTPLTNPNQL